MKMVKSLLLVSAAGLVAASGAQAADLPVKAKPVEYVKVCSLYGAGFYYIPGTDICMKIGGYVRFQESFGHNDSTGGPFAAASGLNNRVSTADQIYRNRYILTHDTRQQTAYGTLRTYMILGFSTDSHNGGAGANTANIYSTRAFIQIAGFTFGKATSYFDFVSTAAVAYNAGSLSTPDTGDGGHIVAAYTAQLGNGYSATLSFEQERTRGTNFLGTAVGGSAVAAAGVNLAGTNQLQDIVGQIRLDQAWGSAAVAVAAHNISASYFNTPVAGLAGAPNEVNGHPDGEWGWAFTAGLRLNAPMFGPGDFFQVGAVYAEGATRYASNTPGAALSRQGGELAFQFVDDAGFTGTAAVPGIFERTTAWSVMASYEHFWTPSLRTSLYGSYLDISRSDALNNAMCASGLAVTGTVTVVAGQATSRAAGCDLDSSYWAVGSRTQWNVTKDLYVGLDVIYSKLNTARLNSVNLVSLGAVGGIQAGTYRVQDQDALSATWRIHRDIVP